MDFPGVALVTGAASGIGRATSILFAVEGCQRIVIADMNFEGLDETVRSIAEANADTQVLTVDVNLRDEESVQRLLERAMEKWGRVDYCCNVAGIVLGGATAETSTKDWELQYEVNLRGLFFCERAEIVAMLKQSPLACKDSKYEMKGSIVNVGSLAGLLGFPDLPAYAATKHGVVGLTKSDAMQYGRHGIRINCVCPGLVDTPITKNMKPQTPEQRLELLKTIGLERSASPDEIAQAIVWLSSGRASFVNGINLSVNGGQRGL